MLQAALLHVVESYVPVIDGLEHDVREVERDVFCESREQPTKRIYFLIREVLDFLVALEPMSASLKRLTSVECIPWVHPEIVPLFRDVDDALSEIVERGRTAHQLLNNALTASRTEASIRQNEDTRRISAWAALLVVPTLVVGHVRHEPRRHPALRALARLQHRLRHHHRRLLVALPPLQERRLALTTTPPPPGFDQVRPDLAAIPRSPASTVLGLFVDFAATNGLDFGSKPVGSGWGQSSAGTGSAPVPRRRGSAS